VHTIGNKIYLYFFKIFRIPCWWNAVPKLMTQPHIITWQYTKFIMKFRRVGSTVCLRYHISPHKFGWICCTLSIVCPIMKNENMFLEEIHIRKNVYLYFKYPHSKRFEAPRDWNGLKWTHYFCLPVSPCTSPYYLRYVSGIRHSGNCYKSQTLGDWCTNSWHILPDVSHNSLHLNTRWFFQTRSARHAWFSAL
jgi:hypothetical protein